MTVRYAILTCVLAVLAPACDQAPQQPPKALLSLDEPQMKMRSFQTRTFDVKDQNRAMRGVVAALQDLGFIIERANGPMGLVTAGKFGPNSRGLVELTVVVRPKGPEQTEVRVNALFNTRPVTDPKVYQNFFIVVERALFINRAETDPPPAAGADPVP